MATEGITFTDFLLWYLVSRYCTRVLVNFIPRGYHIGRIDEGNFAGFQPLTRITLLSRPIPLVP